MTLALTREPITTIPLKMTHDHVIFIGNTRVTLDTVIEAFVNGATPEEIAHQYPTLELADLYAVVGYYLYHRSEVEDYLKTRQDVAQLVKSENEKRFSPLGIRERLLARQTSSV